MNFASLSTAVAYLTCSRKAHFSSRSLWGSATLVSNAALQVSQKTELTCSRLPREVSAGKKMRRSEGGAAASFKRFHGHLEAFAFTAQKLNLSIGGVFLPCSGNQDNQNQCWANEKCFFHVFCLADTTSHGKETRDVYKYNMACVVITSQWQSTRKKQTAMLREGWGLVSCGQSISSRRAVTSLP